VPHYDRNGGVRESSVCESDSVLSDDEDTMEEAAQALREVEVEAVRPVKEVPDYGRLDSMSIDELRSLADKLDVPNQEAIAQQDQLIAAIRRRL